MIKNSKKNVGVPKVLFEIILPILTDKIIIERNKRKVKNKNIITIIFVLVIVMLSGYIIYDKFLLDDKTDVVDKDNLNSDKIQDNNEGNKGEDKGDENKENDVDDDNNGTVNTELIIKKGEIENVDEIIGNYKDYTEDCSVDEIKCTAKFTFTKNDNYVSKVNAEDIFNVHVFSMFGTQIYLLNDGYLYYDVENCHNEICYYFKYNLHHSKDSISKLNKFTDISNIKRIKSYNYTTGVDYSLFLITNDGNVYSLNYDKYDNSISYGNYGIEFSKYEIDDILEYNFCVPSCTTYKVVLKDGTILTKTIDVEN